MSMIEDGMISRSRFRCFAKRQTSVFNVADNGEPAVGVAVEVQ